MLDFRKHTGKEQQFSSYNIPKVRLLVFHVRCGTNMLVNLKSECVMERIFVNFGRKSVISFCYTWGNRKDLKLHNKLSFIFYYG